MHKCVNNTVGNIYHLEQWVDNFFPYSQKQLRFDQPVSIVFQSDEENASRMLGKTAYYDPESMQVVLYTDNRHPKDIMRSLSHELVHHAQNCRGDFKAESGMETGYAQNDPHLRKMEREAYTKGNLIFRDFEDLIKTGKINIEIDFSDSGEPKMSLKEWKNNEINTKLMKKWGYLNESKLKEAGPDDELEEGVWTSRAKKRSDLANQLEFTPGGIPKPGDPGLDPPEPGLGLVGPDPEDEEGVTGLGPRQGGLGRNKPAQITFAGGARSPRREQQESEDDEPGRFVRPTKAEKEEMEQAKRDEKKWGTTRAAGEDGPRGKRNVVAKTTMGGVTAEQKETQKKISVREAKEITRRIIERIKLENK